MYFFEDKFDTETIRRHYNFYEPMTVHESSLSSCVHSILAASIGDKNRAYQFYLNAARLDLDDYNNDTEDGLHITSMGGTWMTVVQGFGGMRIKDGKLSFKPFVPEQWKSFSFKITFRGINLKIQISKSEIRIENRSQSDLEIYLNDGIHTIKALDSFVEKVNA
jgi:maltose phosphorylase